MALEVAVGLVPNEAVTPAGSPEADSVTMPVKPGDATMETVSMALLPEVNVSAEADGTTVKPPLEATFRETLVVSVRAPETPTIVIVYVPTGAEFPAARVSTLEAAVGFVPNEAVMPAGNPEADSVTLPVKPFKSVTEMMSVALLP